MLFPGLIYRNHLYINEFRAKRGLPAIDWKDEELMKQDLAKIRDGVRYCGCSDECDKIVTQKRSFFKGHATQQQKQKRISNKAPQIRVKNIGSYQPMIDFLNQRESILAEELTKIRTAKEALKTLL